MGSKTTRWVLLLSLSLCVCPGIALGAGGQAIKVKRFAGGSAVEVSVEGKSAVLDVGERLGPWTLMEVTGEGASGRRVAILEDFTSRTGHLLIVNPQGVRLDLPKSLEPTFQEPAKLYLGHTLAEVMDSASDLLGDEILSKPGDPEYDEIAGAIPAIRKIPTYSFVGTNATWDKVGFAYGGRTPDFDPAPYYAPIGKIREQGQVWDGLVGGYLPILRFVYPESPEVWTEMIAFAPLRMSNANDRVQPVWYRLAHIENGTVTWTHYIDSYHPFPPRTSYNAKVFYHDLIGLNDDWKKTLAEGMKITVPDERVRTWRDSGWSAT